MIVDVDFPDHWKTRMLCDELGGEVGVTCLLRLWAHCQNRKQWIFDNVSTKALKAICRYDGDAEHLESALLSCEFIDRNDGQLVVVGWDEHNSTLVANWENGKKGGRKKPNGNPTGTQGEPNRNPKPGWVNPNGTHGVPDKLDELDELDSLSASADQKPNPDDVLREWNATAEQNGLAVARPLNEKRRKKLYTRLKSPQWLAEFREAIHEKLPLPGDGWQPDFGWLIENDDNVTKVVEGKYDWRSRGSPPQPSRESDLPPIPKVRHVGE